MTKKVSYVTKEGLKKLQEELDRLQTIERPKISKAIGEAIEKGDISENAEYDAAKDAQGLLEAKIAQLQDTILNCRVIDESQIDTSKVQILNRVTIRNTKTNATMTYTLVSETEADFKAGKLSVTTPIAKALMGRKLDDKVEVQAKLGWQVNTWAVGDLVKVMNEVTDAEIDALMEVYRASYEIATDDIEAIRYQAREEIAIKKMLDAEGCKAFSNTFQDLYGMEQLPGLASQHLMAQGYGYGGEGDWKVAAMTAILKAMGEGGNGCSLFMEDYTYNLVPGAEYSLGAHMLEVCPCCAAEKPRIETHHLGIGMNEKDPARLVFEGKPGKAIVVSLIDMGGRLRLICQDIECVKPILPMPNLPVARVMWKALPSLTTGVECWITAGGAHHTVLSYDVTAEQMHDWANIMGIEFVHIGKDTTPEGLEHDLFLADLAWKLK